MRPLTEKTLDQYIHQLAQQEGGPAEDDVGRGARGPGSASLRPKISHGKLEHIFRYIDDQLNSTQDSLPLSPGMLDVQAAIRSKDVEQPRAAEPGPEAPAQPATRRLRKGKRNLRKPPQPPARTEPREPVADTGNTEPGCLGAIRAQPTSTGSQRVRHLGIFNRGKAVASSNSGPAFSESEFLRSANICRVRPDDSAGCSGAQQPLRTNTWRGAGSSGRSDGGMENDYPWPQHDLGPSRRVSEHTTRRNSANSGHSGHGSANENGSMAGTTKCNRPCCANEISALQPHVQSHPKQAHGMPPALMPAAHGDHCASESAEAAVFVPGRNAGFDTLDIPHVNLYQSRLLNSISECLKEDAALSHSNSDSTDDLNISMLFDEPDTGCELAFNIHNCSQETLSAFDSSFFASQDIPAARCPGDITVSDFGNSRYGLALDSSQMPVWTARSADSMASVDTLPEYVHQGELPPPYPFMAFTPHAMGNDPIYDTRHASRSRVNVCLSAYPGGQWSRSFNHRNDSINAMRNPSMFGSRAMMDSYDPIDFRPFPRHMC